MNDNLLRPYRQLQRRSRDGSEGRFVVEGEFLARRLLASRFRCESVVVTERKAEVFAARVDSGTRVFVVSEQEVRDLVGFDFHRGVLACGLREEQADVSRLLSALPDDGCALLVVLPATFDEENLGSILRTSAAFGVDAIVLGEGGADPFSRRALRVSMGGALLVPIYRMRDTTAELAMMRSAGFDVCAATLSLNASDVRTASRERRQAIVLGNEAEGLSSETLQHCTRCVTMPMAPPVDSLNVGVAAGILIHQLSGSPPPA